MWRIVIQDSNSFRFLTDTGGWDYDLNSARKFSRLAEAAEVCNRSHLKHVFIVMGNVRADGRFDSTSKSILHLSEVQTPIAPLADARSTDC